MARARAGLEQAISDILLAHGQNGKRLSFRQAERLTGLSPATIAELAKGNARTPESVRRFAHGLGEDATRLLTLAGFAGEVTAPRMAQQANSDTSVSAPSATPLSGPEIVLLTRLERALANLPAGDDRKLWAERLAREIELMERWTLLSHQEESRETRETNENQ